VKIFYSKHNFVKELFNQADFNDSDILEFIRKSFHLHIQSLKRFSSAGPHFA